MKIVLNNRTLFRKAYTCFFISQADLGIFKPDVSSGHAAVIILSSTYTQYIKKRNTYIFADNSNNFKDVHLKLAGYID